MMDLDGRGERVGRFVVVRDADGTLYAVAAMSVPALCEPGDDTILMLQGGRMIRVERPLAEVLGWLEPTARIAGRHANAEAEAEPSQGGNR